MNFRDLVLAIEELSDGAIQSSAIAAAGAGGGELPTYVSHLTLEDSEGNREYMLVLAPSASAPGRARDMLRDEGEMESTTLARGVRVVVPDGRVGVISGPGAKPGQWTVTLDDFEGTMDVRLGDVRLESQEDRDKKRPGRK